MALIFADRVRDTSTTTGTGTITLADSAMTGFQKFGDVCANGDTVPYTIEMGGEWEVGIGTYSTSGPTLSRDTIKASSNSGSAVNFSAGTKDVYLSAHASTANFTGLGDTPSSYTGAAGKAAAVNSTGTALEFVPRREVLTANRTYYVRTDGSDSNDGLTNSSGGAFKTIQKAINVALALDMSIYSVTINIGAGAFAEKVAIDGNGNARIVFAGAGYSSTILGTSSGGPQLIARYSCQVTLRNLGFESGASACFQARYGATLFITDSIQLGSATARHIDADNGAYIESTAGTIYISGDAPRLLWLKDYGNLVFTNGVTLVTTAARAFSSAVVDCQTAKVSLGGSITWDESAGSISGKRYNVTLNGAVTAAGGTIPGSSAGTASSGGEYA